MRIFYWLNFLFVFFPIEVIRSNLQVMRAVLFPKSNLKPGIVAVPINLKTDWGIALMANTITLTPGTLTLDVSSDKKILYIHCLAVENPEEFAVEIKRLFESKVLRLEGSIS